MGSRSHLWLQVAMPASTHYTPSTFEMRGTSLPLLALYLKSANLDAIAAELAAQYGERPGFFDNDLLLLDLSAISAVEAAPHLDFTQLVSVLHRHGLIAVAARGGTQALMGAAEQAGLPAAPHELARQDAASQELPPPVPASASPPIESMPDAGALFLAQPLRSGQQAYARGRDLVITAMVNAGAEVIADGHIHVYAPLRGRAIAGARGWKDARIFAHEMRPELVSIAGVWRTFEQPLPPEIMGKPAMLHLESSALGDKLIFEPMGA